MFTDRQIKNAKLDAGKKKQTISDKAENGLCLVLTEGKKGTAKYFIMRYSHKGKQTSIHIGRYPNTSLAKAREECERFRRLLADGIDPSDYRKRSREQELMAAANTFEAMAARWFEIWGKDKAQSTKRNHTARLNNHLLPLFGNMPVSDIGRGDIAILCGGLVKKGLTAEADKVIQTLRLVLDYAVQIGVLEINIARAVNVQTVLPRYVETHQPTIRQAETKDFFKAFQQAGGGEVTRYALLLLMLTAQRNKALRLSQWKNIDFDKRIWRFPIGDMKTTAANRGRQDEDIPIALSDWAVELLEELRGITGHTPFLFPSKGGNNPVISTAAIGLLMNRMGYDGNTEGRSKAVPHGFRSFMTGVCQEAGYPKEIIDRVLSHEHTGTDKAYYRHDLLERQREMLNYYAQWLRERYRQAEKELAGDAAKP